MARCARRVYVEVPAERGVGVLALVEEHAGACGAALHHHAEVGGAGCGIVRDAGCVVGRGAPVGIEKGAECMVAIGASAECVVGEGARCVLSRAAGFVITHK